jgi:Glycosyltransferase family 87
MGRLAEFVGSRWALRVAALVPVCVFIGICFLHGWQKQETDFPNYYTAARLVAEGNRDLRSYYDWTWFSRQMDYAGMERQVGVYSPQTPLTALPMVPFARMPVQRAKRAWLICNLVFLALIIWMLSRVGELNWEVAWLVVWSGFLTLCANLVLGQYYVFLLFLLTAMFYLLRTRAAFGGGVMAGIAFGLKLYGGPYVIYFLAKRNWRAVAGMLVAVVACVLVAVAIFGAGNVGYYAREMLPRSLEGGSVDPYHPGNPTLTTLLRRSFLYEPQLNPAPLWDAPWAFFLLRTFCALAILSVAAAGLYRTPGESGEDFAWFSIAVLLISTSVATYTWVLLALPVILFLKRASGWWTRIYVLATFVLMTLPLRPVWLFPKVFLLMGMFLVLGWEYFRRVGPAMIAGILAACLVVAAIDARRHMAGYREEPARRFEQITRGDGALSASFPVMTGAGLFYQAMGENGYVVRWKHDGTLEEVPTTGDALHPVGLGDGSVGIEEVYGGKSEFVRFEPASRKVTPLDAALRVSDGGEAVSPDGKWNAFTVDERGGKHLFVRRTGEREGARIAGGSCNSWWPAWSEDSRVLIFASDCGRALGVTALYRVNVADFDGLGQKEN